MTNFEKFGKELNSTGFGLVNGKPSPCNKLTCSSCEFNPLVDCSYKKMEWLKAEYEEPKITIPEGTPVDTKVLVSDTGEDWFKRHYAGCVDGFHYAWNEGRTSWSSNPSNKIAWEYMKLYE